MQINYIKMNQKAPKSTHLDTLMRAEVEVKLSWMRDAHINSCTSRNITTLATLFFLVRTEQSEINLLI